MTIFRAKGKFLIAAIILHARFLLAQDAGLDPIDSNSPELSEGIEAIPADEADDLGALDNPQAPTGEKSEVIPPQKIAPIEPQDSPSVPENEKSLDKSSLKGAESSENLSPAPDASAASVGTSLGTELGRDQNTEATEGSGVEASGETSAVLAPNVEQENIPAQSSPDEPESPKAKTRKESIVGSYRLHLGAAGVDFDEDKSYKEHYDTTRLLPSFKVEYFFFDWYATLGVSVQAGMYKDKGYSLDGDGNKVTGESLSLTLFPIQFAGVFAISPFTQKWISLSGWAGIEYIRFSETRPDSIDSQERVRNLKGTRTGSVAGGALHIRIDFFDETSAASMAVIGLHHIYISPYMQTINRTSSKDKIHFSRNEFGVFFTFESI